MLGGDRRNEEQETQNVTESLVELRQIMHGQLQHSQGTVHTLGEGQDTP